MPSRRTTASTREFRCAEPGCVNYIRSRRIKFTTVRDYGTGQTTSSLDFSKLACDNCSGPMRIYNPRGASVSESQRTVAWISPDGLQAANLDEPHGIGPQGRMYAAAGWNRVECDTLQKLDRINAISTAQKSAEAGHEVISRYEIADYDESTIKAAEGAESFTYTAPGVPDIIPTSE